MSIKNLSRISSKPKFEQTSFNILLCIGIPELLLNLVSCHGFMNKSNSTVILNLRYRLVNNYLEKVFYVIENNSKKLSMIPNDLKLIIHMIDQLETYFFMAKNIELYSVENTIKKLHIKKNTFDLPKILILG